MYCLDDAVRDYYEYVVTYLKEHHFFNEDVFQDTVLKCFQVFQKREVHKDNVVKYFLHSYKINFYTKDSYKEHTLYNDELDKPYEIAEEGNVENRIDYVRLRTFFFERYGKKVTLLLRKYNLGGYSIRELEEESGIKNLRYTFKKMTNDARQFLA